MAASNKIHPNQNKALVITTLLAVVFGLWFLRGYFSMFVIAGTMAYLFYPLKKRLARKFSNGTAISLTILTSFLVILTPLVITIILASFQLSSVARTITPFFNNLDASKLIHDGIEHVNYITGKLPFEIAKLDIQTVTDGLKNTIIATGNRLLGGMTSIFSSFISTFTSLIIFLFVFVSFLKNGEKLLDLFRKINPLGSKLSDTYITKVGAMIRGTVQGQFAIAITQGLFGAIAFTIAGYGNFFFIIFAVFTLLSIIPLGAGILAIPAGIVMLLFGNVVGGLVVILEHLVINTNVDNVLRPILVPKTAKLDPALMLVSVFAGITTFGFLGIIVGPTLMIIITTTIEAYTAYIAQSSTKITTPKKGES